jgi:hypothetical protein
VRNYKLKRNFIKLNIDSRPLFGHNVLKTVIAKFSEISENQVTKNENKIAKTLQVFGWMNNKNEPKLRTFQAGEVLATSSIKS